jgi:L,D-transpeptidase ErfK/SrfK
VPGENVVGQVQAITARYEDTLPDIARRYGLGYNDIIRANPNVDPWLPGEGTRVILPTQFVLPDAPRKGIVLNVATMRLYYYPTPKDGEKPIVITHPIGIGRVNWRTPLGKSRITTKIANPSWYPPASIRKEHAEMGDPLPRVVPPGPDNPLGAYKMNLSRRGYLIHGTNKRYGIGMRVSHGCIRMYPEDIERLFNKVAIGTPVNIVNQPFLVGASYGTLYLEAHDPLEEDKGKWDNPEAVTALINKKLDQANAPVDWRRVAELRADPHGVPVPITVGGPDFNEVIASALEVENIAPIPSDLDTETDVMPAGMSVESNESATDVTVSMNDAPQQKYPLFSE